MSKDERKTNVVSFTGAAAQPVLDKRNYAYFLQHANNGELHFGNDFMGGLRRMAQGWNTDFYTRRQRDHTLTKPDILATSLGIFVPPEMWPLYVKSYEDHLFRHDTERFLKLHQIASEKAPGHLDRTAQQNEIAQVFGDALIREVSVFRDVADNFGAHMPRIRVNSGIFKATDGEGIYLAPSAVLSLSAEDQKQMDLRVLIMDYLAAQTRNKFDFGRDPR